jgi:hypothetical protein
VPTRPNIVCPSCWIQRTVRFTGRQPNREWTPMDPRSLRLYTMTRPKEKQLPLARFGPAELECADTKINREWTRMDAKQKQLFLCIGVHSWFRIGQDNPFPLEFCSTKIEDQSDRQSDYSQVIDHPASFVIRNSYNDFRFNDDHAMYDQIRNILTDFYPFVD